MKNILFFGDSLTAGYGLAKPDTESFPALINQKILEAGFFYKAVNAGLSGDTSSGGLSRLNYWLNTHVDVFVLELGINDLTRRIPPAVTYKNLETIIITVQNKYPDVKLALMGMELPPFIPGSVIADFRAIYKKLAYTYHMAFIPFFLKDVAGISKLNILDGVHPNAAGYLVIADNVWPLLKPLLHF